MVLVKEHTASGVRGAGKCFHFRLAHSNQEVGDKHLFRCGDLHMRTKVSRHILHPMCNTTVGKGKQTMKTRKERSKPSRNCGGECACAGRRFIVCSVAFHSTEGKARHLDRRQTPRLISSKQQHARGKHSDQDKEEGNGGVAPRAIPNNKIRAAYSVHRQRKS